MTCSDLFQPFLDWMNTPPAGLAFNTIDFLVAGNRSESNRFVLYMQGVFLKLNGNQLSGAAQQYFSDRISSTGGRFDQNNGDAVNVTLTIPNGPFVFTRPDNGNLIAQFSTLECRDNELLVCTSDFDRTILVVSMEMSTEPVE